MATSNPSPARVAPPNEQAHSPGTHTDNGDELFLPSRSVGAAGAVTSGPEMLSGKLASVSPRNGLELAPPASTVSSAPTVTRQPNYTPIIIPTVSPEITSKRNVAFHGLFPSVPVNEYLIQEYGCKLQRGKPIGGRLYMSKHHICFFSNIDGLNFVIPLHQVTDLEKDMTDHIPNAIKIHTQTTKYTFTSFLRRDTAYDEIFSAWCASSPKSESASRESVGPEDSRTVGVGSASRLIEPTSANPSGELPPFMEREPKTSPQLTEESVTIDKPLDKTFDNDHPPSASTKNSTYPPGGYVRAIKSEAPYSVPTGFIEHGAVMSQHPGEAADVLQDSPQYMASVVYECLTQHGCPDLMSSLDPIGFSSSAVAEGGFGDIWTGRFHNGGAKLAIKVLRFTLLTGDAEKKELKRTAREIYNWSKLEHENVNRLMGVVMFRERLGMVSEWMEHGNLRQYLGRNSGADRTELCIQIARGVAYLHSVNMVHGDLKACNILVSSTGIIKITDFDYSIIPECSLVFSTTSRMGGGTLRWMAPELLLDENPPQRNTKTDIYALGMTFLETVTNDFPYSECRDNQIYRKLAREEHPKRLEEHFPNTKWGNEMWGLLLKCWNFNPASRPTAGDTLGLLLDLRGNVALS